MLGPSGKAMPRTRSYREALLESLTDPVEATNYLSAAFDDSPAAFLKALRNVVQAQDRMASFAKKTGVAREALYRALSNEGNPTLSTLNSILDELGVQTVFVPKADIETQVTPIVTLAAKTSGFHIGGEIVANDSPVKIIGTIGTGMLCNVTIQSNVGPSNTLQPEQGNEESWRYKTMLQPNPSLPSKLREQMTSPLGIPITCNWSQLFGT